MIRSSSIETGTGRKLASALLFAAGSVATIATIAGFVGARWWGFDGVADWRFALFATLTVTAILYGLVFRRALSSVFLISALINAVLLAPLWLGTQAAASSSEAITFVTLDAGSSGDYRRATIEWLDDEEVDVAVIFNTDGWWTDTLELTGAPYSMVGQVAGERTVGTLVLARDGTSVVPITTVEGSDATLRVENGTATLTFIGVADRRPGSNGEADRRIQRFSSINAAATSIVGPVVVAGNLNTSRWSHAFSIVAEGLTNSEDGFGYAATWPGISTPVIGRYIGLPLDHALYAGDITVLRREVGPQLGPDHLPLLFDIVPAE